MTGRLNGRIARLEAEARPASASCRACGLPHVRLPVPVALAEALTRRALNGEDVEVRQLCLCPDCCAAGAHIARLTHGLPIREGTTWLV
jgi:hypothetical protein